MTSRQAGHFFFEPKGYDEVNHATHEHKEDIKVGYNLRRKVGADGDLGARHRRAAGWIRRCFGLFPAHANTAEFIRQVGQIWLAVGVGGLLFRTAAAVLRAGRADGPRVVHARSSPTRFTT